MTSPPDLGAGVPDCGRPCGEGPGAVLLRRSLRLWLPRNWQARADSDLPLPVDLIVSGRADAELLAGSRWHGFSEAARQGLVLVVRPS